MGLLLGTSGRDIFGPLDSDDILAGFDGDDEIATGGGIDIALGGIGNDILIAHSGTNALFGGADADVFILQAGASGKTYIADFEDGLDIIDLSALGVTGLGDLSIVMNSRGAVVTYGGLTLDIRMDPTKFGSEDFIFADNPEAITLDFEDVPNAEGVSQTVPDAYAGFTWSNFKVMEYDEYRQDTVSGYRPFSGDNFVYNDYGEAASIYRETAFDLNAVNLSAAWSDGLEVTLEAYDGEELIGEQVLIVGYGNSTRFELDDVVFDAVTTVKFLASGGNDVSGDAGIGTHFALDDLVYVG